MQKLKIERQERIISELRLSKIMDATEESRIEVKAELKNYIRHGAVKFKSKAKCMQIMSNLKECENEKEHDPFASLHASGACIPKFLVRMQERAAARAMKHEEAKEKRMRLEREKEDMKNAAEEAKRLEDEKAKQERYEAMREKRRQEKLEKIQKEKARLKFIEDCKKAIAHREMKLKRTSFALLKRLVKMKRIKEKKAKALRKRIRLRDAFHAWRKLTQSIWEKRRIKADKFYDKYLQRNVMRQWKTVCILQFFIYFVIFNNCCVLADLSRCPKQNVNCHGFV